MKKFFVWYDNGSGYMEADPDFFPAPARNAEEALQTAGGGDGIYSRVVTGSREEDPNHAGARILAP